MFGLYRYGSELLNVTFDPERREEAASYAFDDDGAQGAQAVSDPQRHARAAAGRRAVHSSAHGMPGVANSRGIELEPAADRPNGEPEYRAGDGTLDEMIGGIEHGIVMRTNTSWSIDDHRNKFQFGCEFGQLIENGKLTQVVKQPSYRGISANFWRSLSAGRQRRRRARCSARRCAARASRRRSSAVGHASPACVFSDVDVFGGA